MLGEKIETLFLALSICAVSIVILLGGMNLSAMKSNRSEEVLYEEQTKEESSEDIVESVINEFSEDSLRAEFSGVTITTWDEYYRLSGQEVAKQDERGIYGTLNEDNCSMQWAGLLALKELSYIESFDTEGMYLMMVLSDASSSQALDIWRGYLCNYLIGQNPTDGVRREYYLQVNAYTGEIMRIEKKGVEGKLSTLFDNTGKMEVTDKDIEIDYSKVPIITVAEYWKLNNSPEEDQVAYQNGMDGYLPMKEAGSIVLKEIHRLFDEDMAGMKLVMSFTDGRWGGWLLNDYPVNDERYKNYTFRMDARSGKIWWLTGGKEQVKYTKKTSFTDEEIIANARSIIKKYNLADVSGVNWNNVYVYNAGKDNRNPIEDKLNQEGTRITNYVEFYSDDGELIQVSTDWETGELWQVLFKDYSYWFD